MRLSWISLVLFAAAAAVSWPAAAQSTGLQTQQACLARHNGALVPGRLTDRGCNIAWEDIEVAATSYEPLAMDGRWGRPQADGASQQVGNEPRGPTGLCRALHEGAVMPGKYHGGECLVGFRGRVLSAPVFEVLLSGGSGGIGGTLAGGSAGGAVPVPVQPPPVAGPPQPCAREGGPCSFSGSRIVAYGAGEHWVGRVVRGGIECSHLRFGDPIVGQHKSCVVSRQEVPGGTRDGVPVGTAWRQCAVEGGECRFQGRQTVRYGAGGRYIHVVADGSQRCDFRSFGHDPAFGVNKHCAIQEGQPLSQVLGDWSAGGAPLPGGPPAAVMFSACGTERQGRCDWSPAGQRLVRYGVGDAWFLRLVNGTGVACSYATHGDPAFGQHKACEAGRSVVNGRQAYELVGRWRHCADEAGTCQVPAGVRLVRYGTADRWVARLVEGRATCGVATFGSDPYFGRRKICEVEEPLTRADTERALAGDLQGLQRQPATAGSGGSWQLGAPR